MLNKRVPVRKKIGVTKLLLSDEFLEGHTSPEFRRQVTSYRSQGPLNQEKCGTASEKKYEKNNIARIAVDESKDIIQAETWDGHGRCSRSSQ